jgi:hypothetical protein
MSLEMTRTCFFQCSKYWGSCPRMQVNTNEARKYIHLWTYGDWRNLRYTMAVDVNIGVQIMSPKHTFQPAYSFTQHSNFSGFPMIFFPFCLYLYSYFSECHLELIMKRTSSSLASLNAWNLSATTDMTASSTLQIIIPIVLPAKSGR